jgi:hypothetical protein
MSIYYYGKLVSSYNPAPRTNDAVLVGDIIKSREDYQKYAKPKFVIRHYQDA